MELKNLSIRQLNSLFIEKKTKPSELYADIFDTSANSEALLHAHLTLSLIHISEPTRPY